MEQLNTILEVSDIEEGYNDKLGTIYVFTSKEMTTEGGARYVLSYLGRGRNLSDKTPTI